MKLLTLNVHAAPSKREDLEVFFFSRAVKQHLPDIIALQEINESLDMGDPLPTSLSPAPSREDNFAGLVMQRLAEEGLRYHMTWLPIKCGYGIYREGVALLSRLSILEIDVCEVSQTHDPQNWRKRAVLGARTEQGWFYSVHLGRWDDSLDPFAEQWRRLSEHLKSKSGTVFLLGDFNAPAEKRGEGYDLVRSEGFYDSHKRARKKEDFPTILPLIDGWQDIEGTVPCRIDHIFCNKSISVTECKSIFDGRDGEILSDHFGVLAEYEKT